MSDTPVASEDSTFLSYSKGLLKSFTVLTVIVLILTLKAKLITPDTTLFYLILFVIGATILSALIQIVDSLIYTNVMMGLGLGFGFALMDMKNSPMPFKM